MAAGSTRYITQKDIDERIRGAKYVIAHRDPDSGYDKSEIEYAKKILAQYSVETENKSPLDSLIEKAEAAGVPVDVIDEPEITDDTQQERPDRAVFMDIRDESFVSLQQTDESVDFTVYAPDLTPIDGGVWETDRGHDLKSLAAELLAASESELAEISDYEKFVELADMNTYIGIPAEFAKMKAEALANMPDSRSEIHDKKSDKNFTVNSPEKISASTVKPPKTGVPVTYHFNKDDVVTGGAKTKFRANIEAIRTLQKVESENRFATPKEQSVMAKYVGWGGIPQAFTTDRVADSIAGNPGETGTTGWENEQKELFELLSPDEYKAARASTLTSFYTPPEVIERQNGYKSVFK